ncbi:hypothetical protein HYV84_03125 [Candidatus Woesearchaeota archaeon]|nr:hypothetical protein [Candidatus Woesearchaeota archaeon]
MNIIKPIFVTFGEKKTEQDLELLKQGKFQDRQLYRFVDRAIDDMKKNPACGIKIPKRLWPSAYIIEYGITNLWKYDMPNGWRLIYTIKEDEVMILNVILEWFNHKEKRNPTPPVKDGGIARSLRSLGRISENKDIPAAFPAGLHHQLKTDGISLLKFILSALRGNFFKTNEIPWRNGRAPLSQGPLCKRV